MQRGRTHTTGAGRLVVPALLAGALAVTGCGGGGTSTADKRKYVDHVNAVQRRFVMAVTPLSTSGAVGTPAKELMTLTRLKTATDGFITQLRAIKPPTEVGTDHTRLVNEFQVFDGALGAAVQALHSNNAAQRRSAGQALAAASSQIGTQSAATIDDINRRLHK